MSEHHLVGDEIVLPDAPNNVSPQSFIGKQSTKDSEHNLRNFTRQSDDDDEINLFPKTKRRVRRFSDSDSDTSMETYKSDHHTTIHNLKENSNDSITVFTTTSSTSRIRQISVSEDDVSDPEEQVSEYTEQQSRIENKKQRLKDKFKTLLNSKCTNIDKKVSTGSSKEDSDDECGSEDEMTSIDKIKEKIKERTTSLKMSICDPDTSDEESNQNNKAVHKSLKQLKRTKLTSPKPQRMSAKQAMENMQKIKSESNRMLREKEVSLPYHRPKALSLQDIMKRRRPAVTSDGKALPIKMNEEQLKQYALSLEERQKEMMELCKSDTEDDEPEEISDDLKENVVNDPVKINSVCNIDNSEKYDRNSIETTDIIQENDESINKVCNNIYVETYQSNNKDSNENISSEEKADVNANTDFENKSGNVSADMELVYNDSIEGDENKMEDIPKVEREKSDNLEKTEKKTNEKIDYKQDSVVCYKDRERDPTELNKEEPVNATLEENHSIKEPNPTKNDAEMESQFLSLKYLDTETIENDKGFDDIIFNKPEDGDKKSAEEIEENDFPNEDMDDINMDEIDTIIENAEIIKYVDSPALVKDTSVLNIKPKLTGAPGMVIDLDGTDPTAPKKLTGVELLKERFSFFANLKTPEEMKREREKRQKPGTLHLKLKQELEDKIAEQRSLEWSKRLDTEKQQQKELSVIRCDESEPEDDIDKIEAKLDENDVDEEVSSSENEEEPIKDDILLEDKPKKRNPLVADEAEESDADETMQDEVDNKEINDDENDDIVEKGIEECDENDKEKSDEDSSEDEESSESEDEIECNKPKKGRILKAFEDSDDEETPNLNKEVAAPTVNNEASDENNSDEHVTLQSQSDVFIDSQDDVLQLAQIPKPTSGDLFTTPECSDGKSQSNLNNSNEDEPLGTQTFSILNTNHSMIPKFDESEKLSDTSETDGTDKLSVISKTQPCDYDLDAVVGMCSGSFSQNCVEFQAPTTQSQSQQSQSQPIGEDVLNMCTGNFYDNQFVTPGEDSDKINTSDDLSQDPTPCGPKAADDDAKKQDEDILKSVLDELNEPVNESVKPLKFFFDGENKNKENEQNMNNTQIKKRFVIDSDDETNENADVNNTQKKRKRFKKKKLEERALQISDDEEDEYSELEDEDEYLSVNENEVEKLVEYDSEENEIEVIPQVLKKKKKKASEFFEQEAELTSEDEWVGSGDEDEAGLDRMEREEGDDETFHQGKLQRELGQIHMRDVLDQDKREVRLIQELLFEDGDLGAGGRQRKFRWRNADGEEVSGTVPDEFADTQEEEFESEEQWRKQRHEREMFLRQMKNEGEKDDELDVNVNRTTIIKANLTSRTMSSLLEEVNQSKVEVVNPLPAPEKKTAKDIPSPKKSFPVFQQSYHGSLLTRGRGALARLAALATPLVADDDAPKVGLLAPGKRNFVFAAVAREDVEPKVTKRKAENNIGTPRLVKKMKTEEKQKYIKNSLLDHMKT